MKSRPLMTASLAFTIIFLIGPFLVIFLAAFGREEIMSFPPQGFTLAWFAKVFTIRMFIDAFFTSLFTALAATATALLLGVPAAYGLVRFDFPLKTAVEVVFASPVVVPGLVVGLALLRMFVLVSNLPVLAGLYLGHTAILFPYTVRVVSSGLHNFDPAVEEAAVSLGAGRLRAFFSVVLPNIRAGVVAAFILAFITSFNNVPVSLFLTGPGVTALPIQMMNYMEFYFDPTIAALSSLLILVTVLVVQGTERALGISKYL